MWPLVLVVLAQTSTIEVPPAVCIAQPQNTTANISVYEWPGSDLSVYNALECPADYECGVIDGGQGGSQTMTCGYCPSGYSCGANDAGAYHCGCLPSGCGGWECGTVYQGCDAGQNCGLCNGPGQQCNKRHECRCNENFCTGYCGSHGWEHSACCGYNSCCCWNGELGGE